LNVSFGIILSTFAKFPFQNALFPYAAFTFLTQSKTPLYGYNIFLCLINYGAVCILVLIISRGKVIELKRMMPKKEVICLPTNEVLFY
jgi:hypothetical protein